MEHSKKYARTKHVPFSPGASSDDKMMTWDDFLTLLDHEVVITEKLDGSNVCLTKNEVFARSHSGPPNHVSFNPLIKFHGVIADSIPENISIFGEYCYAVHSICYSMLSHPLNIFGVRDDKTGEWWDWDLVEMLAKDFELPTVPILLRGIFTNKDQLVSVIEEFSKLSSIYGPVREGVVIRRVHGVKQNNNSFSGLAKWVREGHVTTDEHWKHKPVEKQPYLSFI